MEKRKKSYSVLTRILNKLSIHGKGGFPVSYWNYENINAEYSGEERIRHLYTKPGYVPMAEHQQTLDLIWGKKPIPDVYVQNQGSYYLQSCINALQQHKHAQDWYIGMAHFKNIENCQIYDIDFNVPVIPITNIYSEPKPQIDFSEKIVNGQILEVLEDKVLAKVILNEDKQIFQKRKFDRHPMEGVLDLREGEFFSIKILTRPGERRFLYSKSKGESFFKPSKERNFFKGLESHPIFKPLPKNVQDNI